MYIVLKYWTGDCGDEPPHLSFFTKDEDAFKCALDTMGECVQVWKVDNGDEFPPNEPKMIASKAQ
jgi:hypothetical protein